MEGRGLDNYCYPALVCFFFTPLRRPPGYASPDLSYNQNTGRLEAMVSRMPAFTGTLNLLRTPSRVNEPVSSLVHRLLSVYIRTFA